MDFHDESLRMLYLMTRDLKPKDTIIEKREIQEEENEGGYCLCLKMTERVWSLHAMECDFESFEESRPSIYPKQDMLSVVYDSGRTSGGFP